MALTLVAKDDIRQCVTEVVAVLGKQHNGPQSDRIGATIDSNPRQTMPLSVSAGIRKVVSVLMERGQRSHTNVRV